LNDQLRTSAINAERRRLTLAREFANRINRTSNNPEISVESAMDRFAAAFLIPEQQLLGDVGSNRNWVAICEIMRL